MLPLRPATAADAAAIARLHVAVWRATYGDVAPPEAVARLDEPRRLAQWTALLVEPDRETLLAEDGAALAGFVSLSPARAAVFAGQGEITHLYVSGTHRRIGLGRHLLNAALARLEARGFDRAGVAVVRRNGPARAFYRAAGGTEGAGFTDDGPLWRSENLAVTFPLG